MGIGRFLFGVFIASLFGLAYYRNRQAALWTLGSLSAYISYCALILKMAKPNPPKSGPVPSGKIRLCVAGYPISPPTAKAHYLADLIAKKFQSKYETWYYWHDVSLWRYLKEKTDPVPFPPHLKGHRTSPFCWLERSPNVMEPIGGADHLSKWAQENIDDVEVKAFAAKSMWEFNIFNGRANHHQKAPATAK